MSSSRLHTPSSSHSPADPAPSSDSSSLAHHEQQQQQQQQTPTIPVLGASDEWSPLRAVIVGCAEHSVFPSEPEHMITATMPAQHQRHFRPGHVFSHEITAAATAELNHFAGVLQDAGIRVYRPRQVDWLAVGGYTGAMPRDGLMVVGNTLIEAPFAWRCRRDEIRLAYGGILDELMRDDNDHNDHNDDDDDHPGAKQHAARICRAPTIIGKDTIYDDPKNSQWAINDSRPAFDAADFMRFGQTVLGQLSHVTNEKGVSYLRALLPPGHTLELVQVTDPHAMHIDATILPLRRGLLIYNPDRVTEAALRRHAVLRDWELHPYPFVPKARADGPPSYMCSPWLVLNALSLDEKRIVVEQDDVEFADWLRTRFGMEPILVPFRHVHSIGGSFHCATVDLVRGEEE
ncbi:hypothetical protein B0T14DRAFT_536613 [Immersiella caudata]|uniref:Glycine amidinotransferase, mitochondrial n=1 Tax=Immersiella caudata TaxID=314043 RepID=A0AA39WYV7_9PEZI|nr:hypothetical protein B0T14DRAFT_536613 [Immersiella caudata]